MGARCLLHGASGCAGRPPYCPGFAGTTARPPRAPQIPHADIGEIFKDRLRNLCTGYYCHFFYSENSMIYRGGVKCRLR
jgi:hypothetical protein